MSDGRKSIEELRKDGVDEEALKEIAVLREIEEFKQDENLDADQVRQGWRPKEPL